MANKENKPINAEGKEKKDSPKFQSPARISAKMLAVMYKAMRNFKAGIVSDPIDLSDFEKKILN